MRILLDSNLWRYIVDADALSSVRSTANRSRHRLVIAPAIVHEALKSRDRALRNRLVEAMTCAQWLRLMPEAFWESQELLGEIARVQPTWLRTPAELEVFRRHRYDWGRKRGGFWDRARLDAEGEGRRIISAAWDDAARKQARELRESGKLFPDELKVRPLTELNGVLPEPASGWEGTPIELWRMGAMVAWSQASSVEAHAYQDWVGGSVVLNFLIFPSSELRRFWFHDVEAVRMRRHWLRYAFEYQQQFHRVTDGTPADAQIGTYLVDVDLVVSADRNFIRFSQRCEREAPFRVASSSLVPAGLAAVDAVLALLKQ